MNSQVPDTIPTTEIASPAASYIHTRLFQLVESGCRARDRLDRKTEGIRLEAARSAEPTDVSRRPFPQYFEELSTLIETLSSILERIEAITDEMDI